MKFKRQTIIATVTLVIIILFTAPMAYASGIEGQLVFTAEKVYYQGSTLVVYGYWLNQTNKYIPHTNWVNMTVSTWNGSYWEIVTNAVFTSPDNIQLAPGQMKYWTYRILNSPIVPLGRCWVQVEVNYEYLNNWL